MGVGGTDATGWPRGSESARPAGRRRIHGYDVIRGFSVVSMVGFHLCYDLAFIEGVSLPWFRPPFQDVWRASISWTFLLVAGMMCSHSRSNLRRAMRYLGVAAAIYVVTLVTAVDTPISYGIIYCMGVSTLVAWLLGALLDKVGASQMGARTVTVCTRDPRRGLPPLSGGAPGPLWPRTIWGTVDCRSPRPLQRRTVELAGFPGSHVCLGRLLSTTPLHAALPRGGMQRPARGTQRRAHVARAPELQATGMGGQARPSRLRPPPAGVAGHNDAGDGLGKSLARTD